MQLRVDAAAPESDSDDDISEPEEDSIAGQMALMRGGKVKPSGVHDDYESEYETDTSSEEDEPTTSKSREGRAINEDTDSDSD
jgi:translocation protein SEC63